MDFPTILATSLLSDYFLISSIVLPDGNDEFQLQTPLAQHYAYVTRNLGIEREMYNSHDGTWVKMVFTAEGDKEKLSTYFNEINHSYRTTSGSVLMPDIYDGGPEPKQAWWDKYLGEIFGFFAQNNSAKSYVEFQGKIHIPIKDEDGYGRASAIYSINGFHGVISAEH